MVSVAAALLSINGPTQIPDDFIAEMIYNFICDNCVWPLSRNRHSSNADDPHPTKKQKQTKDCRERAKKCMVDDWLGPIPRCPDKSFECTFGIKHAITIRIYHVKVNFVKVLLAVGEWFTVVWIINCCEIANHGLEFSNSNQFHILTCSYDMVLIFETWQSKIL
jgi:hypothetical protein